MHETASVYLETRLGESCDNGAFCLGSRSESRATGRELAEKWLDSQPSITNN